MATRSAAQDSSEWSGQGESTAILALASRSQPDTAQGAVSVVETQVFRGDDKLVRGLGTVDSVKNDRARHPLGVKLNQDAIAQGLTLDLRGFRQTLADNRR